MHEPSPTQEYVDELLFRLAFLPGDGNKAYGEVQGSPTTLSVLSGDPLYFLLGFKIVSPHPAAIPLPESLEALVEAGKVELELEDGVAWLSLKDQSEESVESTHKLIESFGAALVLAEVACSPGCILCGCLEGHRLVFAEGRCSRLCDNCSKQLLVQRNADEQQANKPTTIHALGLLPAFICVAIGWVTFWLSIDWLLEWWRPGKVIELPLEIMFLMMIALGGVGGLLGFPMGVLLRRSGAGFHFPGTITLLTVLPAGLLGEFLYVCVCGFRQARVFDLALAAQWFIPFLMSYPVFWLVGKFLVLAGIALGCYFGAKAKKKVVLRL